ncbi:MAG: AAA family ATPase [Treponema sp.]|nr:AAA family ATPase [Treponema sp.]
MSEYYFTNKAGEISKQTYSSDLCISPETALELFNSSFPYLNTPPKFTKVENTVACYDFSTSDRNFSHFYACIYQITPGGRAIVSGTEDAEKEFRIQIKAKDYNFIFDKQNSGIKSLQIGIYKFYNILIFVAWKPKQSTANPETPISTQVGIEEIAKAVKYGFNQYKNKSGAYVCLFKQEFLPFYIKNSDWLHDDEITKNANHIISIDNTPKQIIYYGVPGSGKSHAVDGLVKKLEKQTPVDGVKYVRRVVFHPEYTNADFIGQILPTMDSGELKYKFTPGNFTKILKDAYKNPQKNFALVIEEINRGNAAAIFGDIFQLLDRLNSNESDYSANDQFTYNAGWSKYSIDNIDIIHYIFQNKEGKFEPLYLKFGEQALHINYNTGIRLPPNLSLLATMNTSDQNVFTLDNAFQRRWDMQLVPNECADTNQMKATITVTKANQTITWENFQQTINEVIGEKSNEGGLSSMEDKRLGCWFIKAENGKIDTELFANKVLKYLWDDAFKFCHQDVFESDIKNFEELQKRFLEKGFDVFSENCGLKKLVSPLRQDSGTAGSTTEEQTTENSEQ